MSDEHLADDEALRQLLGQTIGGRYRIDELLGEGAMGAVFKATQLGLDRIVAIKVLRPRYTDEPLVAKRFDREAMAASKLDHRNCIQVLDVGTTEDRLKYIVMEHLHGQELRALMDEGKFEVARTIDIATQILAGLEHAHRRGMVHRDLKGENVFIIRDDDDAEVVKIVDFGLVKLLDDGLGERLTRLGMVFGTPAYMAPEQAAGGAVDERTDLYAVGILIYEMLTGAPPFQADAPGILLRMQLVSEPPPLPDSVPESLRAVVMRLLAKAAKDRFESARAARAALEQTTPAKKPASRGGVVFLPAVTDLGEEPPAASERPRRDTQKGTASLAEAGERKAAGKRSGTMLASEADILRASGSMSGRSATMLATEDMSPSLRSSASASASSVVNDAAVSSTMALIPSESTPGGKSGTMLADHVPAASPAAASTTKGVFGTERNVPPPHDDEPLPRTGGANKTILVIAVIAVLALVGLAASGAFGADVPPVSHGDR